jgi:DNA-binding beta-propeller fold protein YncE
MRRLSKNRFALAIASCLLAIGCAAQNGAPTSPATVPLIRPATIERVHWSKTSIGKFADPYGVAVDDRGNVFVADPGSKSVLKIKPDGSREIIGDFSLIVGSKFDPQGVSIAPAGYLVYVADRGSGIVWSVKSNHTIAKVYTVAQTSPHYPRGVAYGSFGGVYVDIATSSFTNPKGTVRCVVDPCPFLGQRDFANPYGIAVDDRGVVYVADAAAKEVYRVDGGGAASIGRFSDPYGVAVTPNGSAVYVADAGAKKVLQGTPDGSTWTEIGTFGDPYGVAAAANGDVYVADAGSKDVWKLTP